MNKLEAYDQTARLYGPVAWRIFILIARRRGRPIMTASIINEMRYWHDEIIRQNLRSLRAGNLIQSHSARKGCNRLSWWLGGAGEALLEGERLNQQWLTEFPIGENPYIKVR